MEERPDDRVEIENEEEDVLPNSILGLEVDAEVEPATRRFVHVSKINYFSTKEQYLEQDKN